MPIADPSTMAWIHTGMLLESCRPLSRAGGALAQASKAGAKGNIKILEAGVYNVSQNQD
jgi:hypothetical protein